MSAHPEMVSGERRNDLVLMRAGRGDWVTKVGAEGVQAIGVRSRGWGIAVKVVDGNARGLHPTTVAVLDQLGLLDDGAASRTVGVARTGDPQLSRHRHGQSRAGCCAGATRLTGEQAGSGTGLNFPAARTV